MKNKTSALDIFKNSLIKLVKNVIVQGLTIIINQSLVEGIVPDPLKIAKIISMMVMHFPQVTIDQSHYYLYLTKF